MTNQEFDKNSLVIDYLNLRKAIGIIGIGLPVILLIGEYLFSDCHRIENSISNYYYTVMGHFLVGALCAVALFLFSYKGYDKTDNRVSDLAALFALGVSFFPTSCADHNPACNILTIDSSEFVRIMHNIFAASFFLTTAYMSYFLFTKSNDISTKQKKERNIIYKICAWIIAISILLIAVDMSVDWIRQLLYPYKIKFILETTALWAFGFSWLVKGQFILKDNPTVNNAESSEN
jgi:hypothetical protein